MTEYHLPGYNFCGPGTDVDGRLARGDQPINELDAACLVHDLVYTETRSKRKRFRADRVLSRSANKIALDSLARGRMKLYAESILVVQAMQTAPGLWI